MPPRGVKIPVTSIYLAIQKKDRMMTLERYCDQLLSLYGDVVKNA